MSFKSKTVVFLLLYILDVGTTYWATPSLRWEANPAAHNTEHPWINLLATTFSWMCFYLLLAFCFHSTMLRSLAYLPISSSFTRGKKLLKSDWMYFGKRVLSLLAHLLRALGFSAFFYWTFHGVYIVLNNLLLGFYINSSLESPAIGLYLTKNLWFWESLIGQWAFELVKWQVAYVDSSSTVIELVCMVFFSGLYLWKESKDSHLEALPQKLNSLQA